MTLTIKCACGFHSKQGVFEPHAFSLLDQHEREEAVAIAAKMLTADWARHLMKMTMWHGLTGPPGEQAPATATLTMGRP